MPSSRSPRPSPTRRRRWPTTASPSPSSSGPWAGASQSDDKGPSAALAPSAARSTYRKYASRAALGRRLAAGPFSSLWPALLRRRLGVCRRNHPEDLVTRFQLDKLLRPASVAVVGASPRAETVGFRVIQNLRRLNFAGPIFPVNPHYQEEAGLRCYPSVAALPADVDAAFVAIPAAQGPGVIEELAARGVAAVEINASGFADGGPDGQVLQARLRALAHGHDIALCGPNNMGFVNVLDRTALWSS